MEKNNEKTPPKKRGRKIGSKNKVKNTNEVIVKPPPKKRGRKPKENIIKNDNPVFDNQNNNDNLIIRLKKITSIENNLDSFEDKEVFEEIDNKCNCSACWNCCHDFDNNIYGMPIKFTNNIFHIYGFFCSLECASRYAFDNFNNTKLLYDRGWSGINIDLDFHTIDFFNFVRKKDENINIAISEKEGEKDLYFFHNRSAINSLSKIRKKEAREIKKVKTKTLNSIIENSKFKNEKINLLSIDVEGHEIEVLRSIDLNKHFPEMIVIEFLERDILDNMEFYNQNIDQVINSEVYRYMVKNDYHFVNWLNCDLIFVHNSIRK